jgi:hypothetical protein
MVDTKIKKSIDLFIKEVDKYFEAYTQDKPVYQGIWIDVAPVARVYVRLSQRYIVCKENNYVGLVAAFDLAGVSVYRKYQRKGFLKGIIAELERKAYRPILFIESIQDAGLISKLIEMGYKQYPNDNTCVLKILRPSTNNEPRLIYKSETSFTDLPVK